MISFILKFFISLISLICSIVISCEEYKKKKEKNQRILFCSITMALFSFLNLFFGITVRSPVIDRAHDYSAVVLSADELVTIEYRLSSKNDSDTEWIRYDGPIKLEEKTILYARATLLWYTSEQISRDVYITDNDLIYFSAADEPGESIESIEVSYNYKDPVINESSGNHYEGYKIKKSDIQVMGTDLNGDVRELDNFKYSPEILQAGKNTIQVEYVIAEGISVKDTIYVNADQPKLIRLKAKNTADNVYIETFLTSDDFIVKGVYENGMEETITDYGISPLELTEGKNTVIITMDGLSDTVILNAIDQDTILKYESESNDEIKSADKIDINVTYAGNLQDDDDIDYYKVKINKKGKMTLRLSHPKIDHDGIYWHTALLSNEDTLVELNSKGNKAETASSPVRVSPGTYYVKVSPYNYSEEQYALTILFEDEDGSYEIEPNDNLSKEAMSINLNQNYSGNLTTENDIDYYKFSLNEKRKVWIDFSHEKTNNDIFFWEISLLDDSDGSLVHFYSTGQSAKTTSDCARLPAGNYYICIKNYNWSDLDYTFCVNSIVEGSETENEDNGDYAKATPMSIGISITGNIQSENDVDFYTFNLQQGASIHVTFTHPIIDSNVTYWRMELHSNQSDGTIRNDENEHVMYISGNSSQNIAERWSNLPADTYYLKVSKYNYNNNDYTITLSY